MAQLLTIIAIFASLGSAMLAITVWAWLWHWGRTCEEAGRC